MRTIRPLLAGVLLIGALGVGAASSGAASGDCPPQYSGHWGGTWQEDNAPSNGSIDGDITVTNGVGTGPFAITGTVLARGTMDLTITCDQVSGIYDAPPYFDPPNDEHIAVSGTLSADGRSYALRYEWRLPDGNLIDSGALAIDVQSSPQSVTIGDSTIWEGGTPTPPGISARAAAVAMKAVKPRIATIPVTLNTPPAGNVSIFYRLVDGTAVRGVDYTDSGAVHKLMFRRGQSQQNIDVPILPNGEPQPDRSFSVQIVSVQGPVLVFDDSGEIVVRDDDGGPQG